jgi:hypothetical protein
MNETTTWESIDLSLFPSLTLESKTTAESKFMVCRISKRMPSRPINAVFDPPQMYVLLYKAPNPYRFAEDTQDSGGMQLLPKYFTSEHKTIQITKNPELTERGCSMNWLVTKVLVNFAPCVYQERLHLNLYCRALTASWILSVVPGNGPHLLPQKCGWMTPGIACIGFFSFTKSTLRMISSTFGAIVRRVRYDAYTWEVHRTGIYHPHPHTPPLPYRVSDLLLM